MRQSFLKKGWCRFGYDPALAEWVRRTLPAALAAVAAPENAAWRRSRGTWFAGVNVLPNDAEGAIGGGTKITGNAVDFIRGALGHGRIAFERGQVSVCYPGYPQKMAAETEAAYRYRRDRDAAHLDGLLAEGPKRRRHVRTHHGFLLGIPMTEASADAAPLVVWEGSHEIVRQTFRAAFTGLPPGEWATRDVTELYLRDDCHPHCVARWPSVPSTPRDLDRRGMVRPYLRRYTLGRRRWLVPHRL